MKAKSKRPTKKHALSPKELIVRLLRREDHTPQAVHVSADGDHAFSGVIFFPQTKGEPKMAIIQSRNMGLYDLRDLSGPDSKQMENFRFVYPDEDDGPAGNADVPTFYLHRDEPDMDDEGESEDDIHGVHGDDPGLGIELRLSHLHERLTNAVRFIRKQTNRMVDLEERLSGMERHRNWLDEQKDHPHKNRKPGNEKR